jgi:hypothetical protein
VRIVSEVASFSSKGRLIKKNKNGVASWQEISNWSTNWKWFVR